MPELPDVVVYLEALERHARGRVLERVRLASPFLVRSVAPRLSAAHGRRVSGFRRLGKRIVFELEGELFLVLHLMIAGRLRWKEAGVKIPKKNGLAAFDFGSEGGDAGKPGSLLLTEASSKKRASLYVVQGEAALAEHDRGGLEVLEADLPAFEAALRRENRTLKRALTDPRIVSGIGNAYSDEILHRAGLSPFLQTAQMSPEAIATLFAATGDVLTEWIERTRRQVGDGFPDKVTAFRPEMAVHGKYGKPCPVCGTPVQRLIYAENEANYCPTCQTGGKLLADRALSRLMRGDWPQKLEELEERKGGGATRPRPSC
jgi:formamidopyrimidine-DNA glycosylase